MSYRKQMKRALLAGVATATFAAALPAISSTTAYAQDYTTGILRGTVQDTTGTPVAGATVVVKSNKGVNRTAVTGANGEIRMPRLPVGAYTVTVTHEGHESLVDQKVSISLGEGAPVVFTMAIPGSDVEEIVVAGTAVGNWDFNSTTTGISVNVDDLFEKTPVARDVTSVALLAPGAGQGDSAFAGGDNSALASIGGSSVGENVYYVNGMNVTNFRNFTGGSTIPFEFYETMDVKTGGFQAEYGRSTGGAIVTTTKSGSNDFHFGVNYIWEPDGLAQNSPATYVAANQLDHRSRNEWNVWMSGAVVEDKLFFYGLYNPRKIVTGDVTGGSQDMRTKKDPFFGAKLDFIPFEGHHFEYTYFKDTQDRSVVTNEVDFPSFAAGTPYATRSSAIGELTEDAIGAEVGVTTEESGGENNIFKYTGVLTDWFTISAMYGTNEYNRTTFSNTDANPLILDERSGSTIALGNWASSIVESGSDRREAYRVDADVYFNAMGEHHVRIGWDKEDLSATNFSKYSGGIYYRYYTLEGDEGDLFDEAVALGYGIGDEYVRVRNYVNGGEIQTVQTALYIQDSWQATDNLSINLGLRNETFDNRNAEGESFAKADNQIAIRAGFSWTPTDTGRVYGNWGRYYLPIATNTNIRMAASEVFTADFYILDGLNPDDTPIFDTANKIDSVVYGDGTIQDPVTLRDQNIKPMYQDEWLLGYEHQFDSGWSVSLTGIYRNLGRLIEDIAIDAAVPKWAAANGYDAAAAADTWSGFHQYVLTNPGGTVTVGTNELKNLDGSDAGLVIMDLTADQLGYPKGERTYKALQFTFSREWDGKWSFDGNYTISRSEGNYEGTVKSDNGQDDAGITTDFDQPGLTDNAFGRLPNDRTHQLKMWGNYALTDYMSIGAKLNVRSPRQMGCIGVHPTDSFAADYGNASWFCNGEATPRGSQMSTDWEKTVDLSLQFTPFINDQLPGDLTLRVDAFNVFNSSAVLDRYEQDTDGLFGAPSVYQRPRYIRLMASYKY